MALSIYNAMRGGWREVSLAPGEGPFELYKKASEVCGLQDEYFSLIQSGVELGPTSTLSNSTITLVPGGTDWWKQEVLQSEQKRRAKAARKVPKAAELKCRTKDKKASKATKPLSKPLPHTPVRPSLHLTTAESPPPSPVVCPPPTLHSFSSAVAQHNEIAALQLLDEGVKPPRDAVTTVARQGMLQVLAELVKKPLPRNHLAAALQEAAVSDSAEVVDILAPSAGTSVLDAALLPAVRAGASDAVKILLRHGADGSARRQLRDPTSTPLHVAAAMGWTSITHSLLENGVSPSTALLTPVTPLHLAVLKRHRQVVHALVSDKALGHLLLKKSMGNGASPLHLAAASGEVAIASILLKAGSDASKSSAMVVRNNQHPALLLSPLHIAAFLGNAKLANLLISHKAMVNRRISCCTTAPNISRVKPLLLKAGVQEKLVRAISELGAGKCVQVGATPVQTAVLGGEEAPAVDLIRRRSRHIDTQETLKLALSVDAQDVARSCSSSSSFPWEIRRKRRFNAEYAVPDFTFLYEARKVGAVDHVRQKFLPTTTGFRKASRPVTVPLPLPRPPVPAPEHRLAPLTWTVLKPGISFAEALRKSATQGGST